MLAVSMLVAALATTSCQTTAYLRLVVARGYNAV